MKTGYLMCLFTTYTFLPRSPITETAKIKCLHWLTGFASNSAAQFLIMELQVHNPLKLLANLSVNPLYHLITRYYYCPLIMCVFSHKSCPTLLDPMDYSPPGSSVHGIFQARILEWVDISFSRGFSRSSDRTWVSCIADRLFFTAEPPGKPLSA